MKKIVSIIIVLLIMTPFIACASGELSGTYVHPKERSVYLVFEGNRVTVHHPTNGENGKRDATNSGTYEVYNNLASGLWPYDIDMHLENNAGKEVLIQMQLSANGKVLFDLNHNTTYVKE